MKRSYRWVLPCASFFATLLLLEGGYRIYHLTRLGKDELNFLHLPQTFFIFDEKMGYRYAPNLDVPFQWFNKQGKVIRVNQVVTNNHGHVSPRPDTFKKPVGEYRIAIVGDSLAACIHNDFPWATTLEDLLNGDQTLKQKLNIIRFKVLNLAIDGIGVSQMPAIVESEVPRYSPDLVLVHFITADIYRRFTWRNTVQLKKDIPELKTVINCVSLPADLSNRECHLGNIISVPRSVISTEADLDKIRKTLSHEVMLRVPWLTPYPQFLSWAMNGKLEQLLGNNPYHVLTPNIDDREESIRVTTQAIRKMKKDAKNIQFLLTPTYWEIVHGAVPKLAGEVMDAVPEIPITPMLSYLPNVREEKVLDAWINHPYDMHWSNLGARLYAQGVHHYLQIQFKTRRLYSDLNTLTLTASP